jgi:PAS domain S-box-containing protein
MNRIESSTLASLINDPMRIWDSTFNGINDSVLLLDPYGVILRANKVSYKLFGKKEGEMVGRHCYKVIHNSNQPIDKCPLQKMKLSRERERLVFQENNRWFEVIVDPIFDEKNKLTGAVHVTRDITEHKLSDEKIASSERLYHSLFDTMNGFAYCRMLFENGNPVDFIYLLVNKSFELQTGLKNVSGKKVSEVIPGIRESDPKLFELYGRVAKTGQPEHLEIFLNALKMWLSISVYSPSQDHFIAVFDVITEEKNAENIREARTRLLLFANNHSADELLEETLNEVEKITESTIGFYHFVDPNQETLTLQNWSTRTKKEFCKAEGKGSHYAISKAGVWVDCFYEKKPVIHNDYSALTHKKGMPAGHAHVSRELVVPVLRSNKVIAILGVGNKPENYTEQDAENVSMFADLVWDIIARKKAEETIRDNEEKYSSIFKVAPFGIGISKIDNGEFIEVNEAFREITGYSAEEAIGSSSFKLSLWVDPEDRSKIIAEIQKSGNVYGMECLFRRKNGEVISTLVNARLIQLKGKPYIYTTVENISDRKQLEEIVRKDFDQISEIQRIGKIGSWEFNIDTGIQTWSEETCRIHEVDIHFKPTVEDGMNFYSLESRPAIKQAIQNAIERGESFDVELEIITAKGNIRWIHAAGNPDLGNRRIFGFFQDISNLKIAERELFKFFSVSSDLMCIARPDGSFSRINPAWEKMLGFSVDEIMKMGYTALIHPDDIKPTMDNVAVQMKGGETLNFINRYRCKDGSYKFLEWRGSPSFNGFMYGIARDITERLKAEEIQRSQNQFIQTLINLSPDIIYVYDLIERKNIYSNDGIEKILGYSVKEIQKMGNELVSSLMHPDDWNIYINETIPKYETAKDNDKIFHTYRMKHKNGSWKWLESAEYIFQRLDNGIPKQIFGVVHDITERIKAEESMKENEEKLSAIYQAIPDPAYIWQAAGDDFVLINFNEAARILINGRTEDFIGKKASRMYQDAPEIIKDLATCSSSRSTFEKKLIYTYRSLNERKHLRVKYTFVPQDMILVITEDLTDKKKPKKTAGRPKKKKK